MGTGSTTQSLDNFLKDSPGRVSDPFDIDSVITPSGDLKRLEGIDVVVKSLSRIFLIARETYIFDPNFGTGLFRHIFEPADETTLSTIELEVQQAIDENIDSAEVTFDISFFSNRKGFQINLTIKFEGRKKNLSIGIDENMLRTLPK